MTAPVAPQGRRHRLGWGLGDQALSSASNFALAVVAANQLDARSFGVFSIAVMTYTLAISATRALVAEPLGVRFAGEAHDRLRSRHQQVLGLGVLLGLGAAAVAALAAVVAVEVRPALLPLAVCFPFLVVQDVARFSLTTSGRSRAAFVNDAVWIAIEFLALAALWKAGSLELGLIVLAWGLAAGVAALVGLRQLGVRPDLRGSRAWLADQRDLWPRFLVESISSQGSWQLALYGIGVVVSLEAVGSIRAAQTLLGPITVIFLTVPLVVFPELARSRRGGASRVVPSAAVVGVILVLAAVIWGGAMVLLPDRAGEAVLGDSWAGAQEVLVPLTLYMALTGLSLGALAGLRTHQAARASVRAGLTAAPPLVLGGVIGGALGGLSGAMWAMVGAGALAALLWWTTLLGVERDASAEHAAQ